MAKIEIWSKDVGHHKFELLNDPQHLYLIFTKDNGQKKILRGGPKNNQFLVNDELIIIEQDYSKFPDDQNDGTHIGEVIVTGNELDLIKKWQKMWQKGQTINLGKYDYEFLTQNSNTAILQMANVIYLDDEIDIFIKKYSLWAPAHSFQLEKGGRINRLNDVLVDGIEATESSVRNFKVLLKREKISTYVWIAKIAKVLNLKYREIFDNLKDLINDLLDKEQIDKEKPIVVIEENKTGRNEIFLDQLTGIIMDRNEFVSMIKTGQYTGYTIADIDNLLTPMSKPDGISINNLG
ncbi:MAG: hypothetical protein WC860_08880 [Candidatus Margulisiibacteriota bacterium]|jgi:hypothetical protein